MHILNSKERKEMEVLAESRVRDKNEVTIPKSVRLILNVVPYDMVRWERDDNGIIYICKVVTRKVNNKCGGE